MCTSGKLAGYACWSSGAILSWWTYGGFATAMSKPPCSRTSGNSTGYTNGFLQGASGERCLRNRSRTLTLSPMLSKTASADQSLLWHLPERREDPNLDRHQHLCADRPRQEGSEARADSQRNLQILSIPLFEKSMIHQVFSEYRKPSGNRGLL